MPYLKEDIRSLVNTSKVLARKGEQISVISNHDGVMIVLALESRHRFACYPEQLTDEPTEPKTDGIPPVEAAPPAAIRRPKRAKPDPGPRSADPSTQSSLF